MEATVLQNGLGSLESTHVCMLLTAYNFEACQTGWEVLGVLPAFCDQVGSWKRTASCGEERERER